MSNVMFFIWLAIALTQITLFTIYLVKRNKTEIIEEKVDIIPICNYNGKTYWLDGSNLYREDRSMVTMDTKKAERIDQLNSKDLSVSEVIFIVETIGANK